MNVERKLRSLGRKANKEGGRKGKMRVSGRKRRSLGGRKEGWM